MRPSTQRPSRTTLAATTIAIALVATAAVNDPPYQLLYNPSPSAPRGWYLRTPIADPAVGSLVVLRLPDSVANFADARRYLPRTVPILKHIAATAGDFLCEHNGTVQINGHTVAKALHQDASGRPLTPWRGCRALTPNEIFLLNATTASSFDSRYYGPLSTASILGRAIPLKTHP